MRPKTGKFVVCNYCGEEYYRAKYNYSRKYCSQKCYYASRTSSEETRQKLCEYCYNKFTIKFKSQIRKRKYCSSKCATLSQKTGNVKNCLECNVELYSPKRENRKFCSVKCHNIFQTNEVIKMCVECNQNFVSRKYQNRIYCSVKCLCRHNNKTGVSFKRRMNTKPEQAVSKILENLNISFIMQKRLITEHSCKYYDFYIPSMHLLLEVDGVYWHGKGIPKNELSSTQKHNKENDDMKTLLALQQGYTLKRIWGDEITEENVKEVLCLAQLS